MSDQRQTRKRRLGWGHRRSDDPRTPPVLDEVVIPGEDLDAEPEEAAAEDQGNVAPAPSDHAPGPVRDEAPAPADEEPALDPERLETLTEQVTERVLDAVATEIRDEVLRSLEHSLARSMDPVSGPLRERVRQEVRRALDEILHGTRYEDDNDPD